MDDLDPPNFQVENIIQKMKRVQKIKRVQKMKKNKIQNNFKQIEEFEILDNLIKNNNSDNDNDNNNDNEDIIEGLEVNRKNYDGWDWVDDSKYKGNPSERILKRLETYYNGVNVWSYNAIHDMYMAFIPFGKSGNHTKDEVTIMKADIDNVYNATMFIISILIATLFAKNWFYVLFQSKLDKTELFDLYTFIENKIESDKLSSTARAIMLVTFNCLRFIIMFPHYFMMLLISFTTIIQTIINNNVPDVENQTFIYQILFMILYILGIIFIRYGVKFVFDILKLFVNGDFIKNPFIIALYSCTIFMFAVSYYEPIKEILPNFDIDSDSIPTKAAIAFAVGGGISTIIAICIYFIFTVPLAVPIGIWMTVFVLFMISFFGKNLCTLSDPNSTTIIESKLLPEYNDDTDLSLVNKIINLLYTKITSFGMVIGLFMVMKDFTKLSTGSSIIPNISVMILYISFVCLLILAFGTLIYSQLRLLLHEWYIKE